MRLSTAIRIGSMTTQQITGKFSDGGNGRCALGAALDAVGYDFKNANHFMELLKAFPAYPQDLMHDVWQMNDGQCRWEGNKQSRERIADYVEQWENDHDGYVKTGVTESKPLQQIAMEAK